MDYLKDFIGTAVLKQSIKECNKSEHQHRLGAIVFKGNKVISRGFNQIRHCSRLPKEFNEWKNSLHAEQNAMLNAKRDLKGYSLLVIRMNKDGDLQLAKPCSLCEGMAMFYGIKEIFYSTSENTIKRMKI